MKDFLLAILVPKESRPLPTPTPTEICNSLLKARDKAFGRWWEEVERTTHALATSDASAFELAQAEAQDEPSAIDKKRLHTLQRRSWTDRKIYNEAALDERRAFHFKEESLDAWAVRAGPDRARIFRNGGRV